MQNTIHINLVEDQQLYNQYGHTGRVVIKDDLSMESIVDEMLKDGLEIDKQAAMAIIEKFNKKATDLVLSGFNVDTGLFTMRPIVKGPYNEGNYQADVLLLQGLELREAISETEVEVLNKTEFAEKRLDKNLNNGETDSAIKSGYLGISSDYPACGHAFRAWLFRS